MFLIKQSSATQALVFFMADSTDHVTGKTGLTPTVTLSKNGAAFAAAAGAVSEIGNGFYKVAPNATDSNTLGVTALSGTAIGADQAAMAFLIVAFDPAISSMGLSLAKGTNITGFNDILATSIVSAGAITTNAGAVSSVGTVATLSGHTAQTGDAFARIGSLGAGLTAIAPASTALSSAVWTAGKAGFIDEAISGAKTLTTGERATLAALIESRLLNEGDGQMLINAIVAAIGNSNIDQLALIAALRADLERANGPIKNIESKTSVIPASPAVAGEATAALVNYDPPTRAEATQDKAEILTRGNLAWITGSGSGGGATAAEIWGYESRTLTSGGGGDGSDPLINLVPGSYADGTAGAALGRLNNTPPTAPVIILPNPSPSDGMTTVYIDTVACTGSVRAGIEIEITLSGSPKKTLGGKVLEEKYRTIKTGADGRASASFYSTDQILPDGLQYHFRSPDLGLDTKSDVTGDVFDIGSLV